jgi:Mg/Co/Ni transporter MgtE
MDSMLILARAFAEQHAQETVDALEELSSAEAGAMIGALPAESAAELLRHIPAPRAAECLAEMPQAKAVAAVRNLAPSPAADILRRLPMAAREPILAALARWRRVQIELVLRQPRQTVGAWMDTRIATARPASTAGEALRRMPADNTHGWLFVTGASRRLKGAVRIGMLARGKRRNPY